MYTMYYAGNRIIMVRNVIEFKTTNKIYLIARLSVHMKLLEETQSYSANMNKLPIDFRIIKQRKIAKLYNVMSRRGQQALAISLLWVYSMRI